MNDSVLRRFAPGLAALAHYDRAWLRNDLLAGLSVTAVAVPIAIAYSQLAGVPAVYGLYASILPLVVYAALGTSRQLILAPDGATCAIVAAIVLPLSGGDPARAVALSMTLAMITGLVCIVAGLARMGFLTSFLARPILAGYLNGIAISIISGQLGKLFGFRLEPAGFFRQTWEFVTGLGGAHGLTLAVGLTALAGLRVLKRVAPRFPAPLLAVALGIAAARVFGLGEHGVALLGAIPAGLPSFRMPHVTLHELEPLAYGALGLALISFNSAMVTARGFALKNRYEIDANQEFIALGVADIGAGLLQGYAISGADSRTAVNDAAGGRTQVTGLVAAALIVLTLLFLTGALAALPIAVLAAVLIHSALGLFDLPGLARLRRVSPAEFRLSLVTLLGVITVGVLPGVAVAVGLALLQLLIQASRPHDALLGRMPGTAHFRDTGRHREAETLPGFVIFRFDAQLVFFNADHFKARLREVVAGVKPPARCVILAAQSMPAMDSTGARALEEAHAELAEQGVVLAVAGAHGSVRDLLDRTGLAAKLGNDRFFPSVEAAVARLKDGGA